ncbi:succinylglutamate desuccinylase/aspartoacylase domain-containing protein [Halobacterium zhouii]|uniref:succinylglutamate desuccinylase/aspartoacylase domain-containing protein n=1 Tax=Halobacterium zhouii TaxID=2902624 RepID=UPI001E2D01AB|nr:succinylglutamate desuccinylase/aspartoacylase family protein [Halobacterium zhouii]
MFGERAEVDATVLGDGDPDLAVVGGIHGDEPSGVRAIRHVLDTEPDLERAVKFVVANPPAGVAHRRYLDVDMNRVFPGDPDSPDRERRLAAQLADEIGGSIVLSLHSTHSSTNPIAFVSGKHPDAQAVAARLPVEHVVNHDPVVDGAFTSCKRVVSVEVGRQLTDAATTNATKLVRSFLRMTDALPDEPTTGSPDFHTLTGSVEKPADAEDPQLLVDNFREVSEGTTYATTSDAEFVADDSFYPILMSETGYDHIFGYRGRRAGDSLQEARAAWGTPLAGDE